MTKPRVPVVEGLFEETSEGAGHLVGGRCASCGASYFPKQWSFCRNPGCDGGELEDVALSTTGSLWSFTDNRYAPPVPYPAAEPFEPYGVAAVRLDAEQMIVLGQVARGVEVATLAAGAAMRLVVEPLFEDDDAVHTVWKWSPV